MVKTVMLCRWFCASAFLIWICLVSCCQGYQSHASYVIDRLMKLGWLENEISFDQYILSEEYSPVVGHTPKFSCNKAKTAAPWIIHGLWPTRWDRNGPTRWGRNRPRNCHARRKFNKNSIKGLVDDLDKKWTNLKFGCDKYCFWKHEWLTHGTCSPMQDEYNYFSTGLNLFDGGLNFDSILQRAGILPLPYGDSVYSMDQILSAFEHDVVDEVKCWREEGEAYLMEIRICLNKDDLKPSKCMRSGSTRFNTCTLNHNKNPKTVRVVYKPLCKHTYSTY